MVTLELSREKFKTNPALFLEEAIKEFVATSPSNRLQAFNGEPIWEEPLIGVADGDDPIFQEYKTIIGDFHFTPREALAKRAEEKGIANWQQPPRVSVISWIVPTPYETRLSFRRETLVPSLRWNHTRWQGQAFLDELARHMESLLEGLGQQAVAPDLASFCTSRELANGPAYSWSHKHIAYATGLGTFGLHATLITPRGVAHRCGSLVTDVALRPTPRVYPNHTANCLYYREASCLRCVKRCPVRALSKEGLDKKRCRDFNYYLQGKILKAIGRAEGYLGRFPVCGLCQTKVPCESMIPPSILAKQKQ